MKDLLIGVLKTTIAVGIVLAAFSFANASSSPAGTIECKSAGYDCDGGVCVGVPFPHVISLEADRRSACAFSRFDLNRDGKVNRTDIRVLRQLGIGQPYKAERTCN